MRLHRNERVSDCVGERASGRSRIRQAIEREIERRGLWAVGLRDIERQLLDVVADDR